MPHVDSAVSPAFHHSLYFAQISPGNHYYYLYYSVDYNALFAGASLLA